MNSVSQYKNLMLYPACLIGGYVANKPLWFVSEIACKILAAVFKIEYQTESSQSLVNIRKFNRLVARISSKGFDKEVGEKCWRNGTTIPIREEIVYRWFFWKIVAPILFFNTSKPTRMLLSSLYFATAHLENNQRRSYLVRQWVGAFILGAFISVSIKKIGLIGAMFFHAGLDLFAGKNDYNLSFREMFKVMKSISVRDTLTPNKIVKFMMSCVNEAADLCFIPVRIPFRIAELCGPDDVNETTYLKFRDNKEITDEDLQLVFDQHPYLRRLDLSGCERITDVRNLPKSMKYLDLSRCTHLKDVALHDLPEDLIDLRVSKCDQLTDQAFTSRLTKLKELNISACSKLTDDALMHTTNLEFANLVSCRNLKGDFFKHLTNLQALILIDCTSFDTNNYKHFSSTLHTLAFGFSRLTSAMINGLADKNITTMRLCFCALTDEEIQDLPKSLETLELIGCTTSSEGLKYLPESLRELKLTSCSQISDEMLQQVQQHIKIERQDLKE